MASRSWVDDFICSLLRFLGPRRPFSTLHLLALRLSCTHHLATKSFLNCFSRDCFWNTDTQKTDFQFDGCDFFHSSTFFPSGVRHPDPSLGLFFFLLHFYFDGSPGPRHAFQIPHHWHEANNGMTRAVNSGRLRNDHRGRATSPRGSPMREAQKLTCPITISRPTACFIVHCTRV